MLEKIVMKLLAAKLDAEAAKQCPVGGEVNVKGVARLKILGMTWELGLVFKRTK